MLGCGPGIIIAIVITAKIFAAPPGGRTDNQRTIVQLTIDSTESIDTVLPAVGAL